MLATATLAVEGLEYDTNLTDGDTNCGNERLNGGVGGDTDFVQCQTAGGPIGLIVKPGLGYIPAKGGPVAVAAFSSNGFGNAIGGNREVSVWAEWVHGNFVTGFDMLVCNDRDMDNICTNIGDNDDQLRDAYSNQAQVASAPCSDPQKAKDRKECGTDPTDAEVRNFCMMPANAGAPFAKWNDNQIVVFIGNWVGADPFKPNVGNGISSGNYEVWMKLTNAGGFPTNTCVPPECDDRVDNDGDGDADFQDKQCNGYDDFSEKPECSDGRDNNDDDALADVADPNCYDAITGLYDASDNNEKM